MLAAAERWEGNARMQRRCTWRPAVVVGIIVSFTSCAARIHPPHDATLAVGPGPEDLVVATWPHAPAGTSKEVAITSVAARRWADVRSAEGFVFIGVRDGNPVVLNARPHMPDGIRSSFPPWQGLYWQPDAMPALGLGPGVLAATRTARWRPHAFWPPTLANAGGTVDFFTWGNDCPGAREPRLVYKASTPTLRGSINFNAVAVARDGTVYASIMSFLTWHTAHGFAPRVHRSGDSVHRGAIYMIRPDEQQWSLVAYVSGANGLALDKEERHLFVNSSGTGRVFDFTRVADGVTCPPDSPDLYAANPAWVAYSVGVRLPSALWGRTSL